MFSSLAKPQQHWKDLLSYFSFCKFSPLDGKNPIRYKKLNVYMIFYWAGVIWGIYKLLDYTCSLWSYNDHYL